MQPFEMGDIVALSFVEAVRRRRSTLPRRLKRYAVSRFSRTERSEA